MWASPPATVLSILLVLDAWEFLHGVVGKGAEAFQPLPSRRVLLRPHSDPQNSVGRIQGLRAAPSSFSFFSDNDDAAATLRARLEEQTRASLVEALVGTGEAGLTPPLELVGKAAIPVAGNNRTTVTVVCAVLSMATTANADWTRVGSVAASVEDPRTLPCLPVPLDPNRSSGQFKLLECAVRRRPLSKSVLLGLNSWLVNRDNGLFDNVPWNTWTIDPQMRNLDAASNPILPQFHLGKRDAYNRFLGKDWQGKSAAIGNLALRLKFALEPNDESGTVDKDDDESASSPLSLGRRILQLQIREQEMELAELEYQLAVARQQRQRGDDYDSATKVVDEVTSLEERSEEARRDLDDMRTQLRRLEDPEPSSSSSSSWVSAVLQDLADRTTNRGQNAAPYRGATGYAPMLDTPQDLVVGSSYQYASPYELMAEILRDQLRAEIIGAVLESASLLDGSTTIGGAVVLRRIVPNRTVAVAGERLTVPDSDEDFGNRGVKSGETVLVECDADEAIGLALACRVPLRVESEVWERSSVMMCTAEGVAEAPPGAPTQALPLWKPRDPRMTLLWEGQATNRSSTGRALPLRIPRTTVSLFDSLFEPRSLSAPSSAVFPTDNPIQSLAQYDRLSTQDKARTLLGLSNFDGRLPRPRVVRQNPAALDDLLLPLIDESTRRQYYIRDARRKGDDARVRELEAQKSRRQVARERAELARERGADDEARRWDREAELYAELRADVTQDEGSYSRFLDRDEWYERTRAAQAKKLDKRKFGTLLDGIHD